MAVSLKVMRSFIPTDNVKYKRLREEDVTTLAGKCLLKLLKVSVVLVGALLLGNVIWVMMRGYADEAATQVDVKKKSGTQPAVSLYNNNNNNNARDQLLLEEQLTRKSKIKQVCRSEETKEPKFLSAHQKNNLYQRLFVDHKNRFVYCSVPKSACTQWKQIILKSSEIPQYENQEIADIFPHYDNHFRRISDLNSINSLKVLDRYYVFTLVRDPMVRLVSAWRDKFQHHAKENRSDYKHFHHEYGRHIIKRYRTAFTPDQLERGYPITFNEYIEYITSFSNANEMNEHWIPATNLCRPCHLNYNFMGKFENQKLESEYLIDKLNIRDFVPDNFFKELGEKSREEAKRLLINLPIKKREILADLYRDDAHIFGYDLNTFLNL